MTMEGQHIDEDDVAYIDNPVAIEVAIQQPINPSHDLPCQNRVVPYNVPNNEAAGSPTLS